MANLKVRYLIVILLLALTASVVNSLQYDVSQDDETGIADLQSIPLQIGKWKGQDFPLKEMVYEILETKAIIHRAFVADSGANVFLSIVHYHDTKVDFHAPEACLGGSGQQTKKTNKTIIFLSGNQEKNLEIAEMITTRAIGQTLTYYFYKSGQFAGSNYIKMRLSIAANKLIRNDTRGSLIRVSTSLTPGNEAGAESLLLDFIKDLFPYVQRSL